MEKLMKVRSKGFKKFTIDEWLSIEKEISQFEMKVCMCMKKLGNEEEEEKEELSQDLNAMGEEVYLASIRKVLEKYKLLPTLENKISEENNQKKKKAPKKGSKKDQQNKKDEIMIIDINIKKMQELAESYMKDFDFNLPNVSKTYGIERESKIELKIMILIYFCRIIINGEDKESAYEFIIGVSRIIKNLKKEKIQKVFKISETCLKDLESYIEKLKKTFNYEAIEIFTDYPRLILYTNYSQYFPIYDVSPYKNQIELISTVKRLASLNQPGLVLFKSNIGSGKTTVAVALASSINQIRKITNNKTIQLIFACSIEVVRHYVGRLAYNSQVTFALAHSTTRGPKITNSFSCKNDKFPNLIITDLYTANNLLLNKNDYILFIDEPTYEADKQLSKTLKYFQKVFSNSPKITILSSATLPNQNHLESYLNYYKLALHKNAEISEITSGDNFVGCQIFNSDNNFQVFMPHQNCKTVQELKKVVKVVFADSLLRRCYNSKSLFSFYNKLMCLIKSDETFKEFNTVHLPNFKKVFDDVENISQNKIIELSKIILDCLINFNNDDLVYKLCSVEKDENYSDSKLDYNLIGTKLAYKFLNGCLIITKNSKSFAFEYFKESYKNISENLIRDIKLHFKSINNYKEEKKMIEQKFAGKDDVIMEKSKSLKLPGCFGISCKYEINTAAHLARFITNSNNLNNFKLKPRKSAIINETLLKMLLDDRISVEIIALLLCGVGIYDPDLDEFYLKEVLRLAQEGYLAFLISDTSLAYGVNFPINNVIITHNIGVDLTISTLFQILGRAGRVGYSWAANAFLDNSTIDNIDQFIKNNDKVINKEATNLTFALKKELGLDFTNKNLINSFSGNTGNKILLVYSYNHPICILSSILIILYHISLIKKSFSFQDLEKINLNVFFEFVKLNTEVHITNNYNIQFAREKYNTIYFIGMYPNNPFNLFLKCSQISRKVVVFDSYSVSLNKNKQLENFKLPENVLIFKNDNNSSIMMDVYEYVKKQLDGNLSELQTQNITFNENYYLKIAEIDKKEKKRNALLNDMENQIINNLYSVLHNFNTKKKNICFKLINKILTEEDNALLTNRDDNLISKEIIKHKFQIFIFGGKKETIFDKNEVIEYRNLDSKVNKINEIFEDRKIDIFIGCIIEKNELIYIRSICNRLEELCVKHEIPKRYFVMYSPYLDENSLKIVCYFYVDDGINKPMIYLKNIDESRCNDDEGIFFIKKNEISDWTLI